MVPIRRRGRLASAGLVKPEALGRALIVVAEAAHVVEAKRRRARRAHGRGPKIFGVTVDGVCLSGSTGQARSWGEAGAWLGRQ